MIVSIYQIWTFLLSHLDIIHTEDPLSGLKESRVLIKYSYLVRDKLTLSLKMT